MTLHSVFVRSSAASRVVVTIHLLRRRIPRARAVKLPGFRYDQMVPKEKQVSMALNSAFLSSRRSVKFTKLHNLK